jgi:hypothetical protein
MLRLAILVGLLTLLPMRAFAEVCDKLNPDWDGVPVSYFAETLSLMTSSGSLILLVCSALALRFKSQWGALAVVVLWSGWVSIIAFYLPSQPINKAALIEGCIGSPSLFIALVAAICIGLVLFTAPINRREP